MCSDLSSAQDTSADYKALVCVYLFGGNDGNNMVIPLDEERLTTYKKWRSPAELALDGWTPASKPGTSAAQEAFAFHPKMTAINSLYEQGKVAVILNMGNLRESPPPYRPYTSYTHNAVWVGPGLFSHADQTSQTQAGSVDPLQSGWLGRLMREVAGGFPLSLVSMHPGDLLRLT